MRSESVGGEFEGFEGSTTDDVDNGSMETDAGAVVNARYVTGSVAIS